MSRSTTDRDGPSRATRAPDLREHARAMGYLYIAGAALLPLLVLLPHSSGEDEVGLLAVGGVAAATGAILLARQGRFPAWSLHLLVALATAIITLGINFTADAGTPLVAYYFWVGVYAFYFFTPRQAAGHVALLAIAYGSALEWGPGSTEPLRHWVMIVSTIVVVGLLIARLVSQVRDRAAEAAARAEKLLLAEERTRLILETAQEGYLAMDADGRVVTVNARAEEMTGWPRAAIVGRRVSATLLPERIRAGFERELAHFLETGESPVMNRTIELVVLHRDGHEFPVELAIAPLCEDGAWRFNAFVHDITQRKRDEQRMREQLEDLSVIADVARDLSSVTDAHAARPAICKAASELSAAKVGLLFEPDPRGQELVSTAVVGAPIPTIHLAFTGAPSGAAAAFSSGQPFFVADARGHPAVDQRLVERLQVASALWQPVLRNGVPIGVLAVAWESRVSEVTERVASLMDLLAAEAAVAIERADLLARLEAVARTDDLTGLANRRAWDEHLPRELSRAGREEYALCIAMFDLDRFKAFNDQQGHQAGDRLLKQVTATWRDMLRPSDILARYGGEEFVLLLPNCPVDEAERVVERLRTSVVAGQTCSAGLAVWDGEETADELLSRVDSALYDAKRQGRDRSVTA